MTNSPFSEGELALIHILKERLLLDDHYKGTQRMRAYWIEVSALNKKADRVIIDLMGDKDGLGKYNNPRD